MKLIPRRRKPEPTKLETAAKVAKLGGQALTAQRVARRGHKNYKRGRRLAFLGAIAAIGATVAKKLRGGHAAPTAAGGYTPPQTGSGNVTPSTVADGAPTVNGSPPADPPTDEALDVEAPNESTPPPPEKSNK